MGIIKRIIVSCSCLTRTITFTQVLISIALALLPIASQAREIEVIPEELIYCSVCHGTMLSGNKSTEAPGIAGLPAWFVEKQLIAFSEGWRGTHPKDISGSEMYPVAVELKREQFSSISKTVSELSVTPKKESHVVQKKIEMGEQIYQICAACHGKKAEGNELLNAPPLNLQGKWYVKKQLFNYKEGLRGYKAEDVHGKTMAATAALLSEKDIELLANYISSL